MAPKKSDGTDKQSLNIAAAKSGYFVRTARPIYALVFLLPFIILYEILVLAVNPQLLSEPAGNIRGAVVSFVWVQNFLQYIGMNMKNAWLFAPITVILTLLILQLAARQSWKVRPADFLMMSIECIVLAIPLIILSLVLNRVPNKQPAANNPYEITVCKTSLISQQQSEKVSDNGSPYNGSCRPSVMMGLLTGIGAGIYEELIFRLFLISLSMIFFETVLGIHRTRAVIISVIISSVLFSLHHHFIFLDGQFARKEIFTMTRFAFRTVAGVFFAIIYAVRGFGIAAGTHSFYDIIATLLNAWLFEQY
jgi:hypothetical protein